MTRMQIVSPVYAWHCDACKRSEQTLTLSMVDLPSAAAMRERGWHIAKKFGDVCPGCLRKGIDPAEYDHDLAPVPHDSEDNS